MTSDPTSQPRWTLHLQGLNQMILEVMRLGLEESGEMARLHFGLSHDVARRLERLTVPQVRLLAQLSGNAPILQLKETAGFSEMLTLAEENAPVSDGLIAQMAHSVGRATR